MKRSLLAHNALMAATLALVLSPVALAATPPLTPLASPPAPIAAAASPGEEAPVAQQFTLANGMTLIVRPDRRAPTVAHMLWVRVGSMDEVDGTSGVAHVLEHMMFKGTPDLKPGEFSRRVAALGGRDNAFTSRDATAYHQQVPSHQLEAMMRLEADRFARTQWADEEFVREIEVIKEERRQRTEESPRARMFEALNAMIFQANPYRRPIIGWMSDLDAMTPDDVRAFYQRWYSPANAAVVIAGDVDVAQVRTLAENIYGRIPSRALPARKPRDEPLQVGPRRLEFRAVADQALVALAWKVPRWTGEGDAGEPGAGLGHGAEDPPTDHAIEADRRGARGDGGGDVRRRGVDHLGALQCVEPACLLAQRGGVPGVVGRGPDLPFGRAAHRLIGLRQ